MKITQIALLGAAVVLLSGFMEIGGVSLPDTLSAGDQNLMLNGAGLRKKLFVKVYAGGLYLKARSSRAEAIIAADEPMGVRMHFIYGEVSAEKLIEAWNEGFEAATGGHSQSIAKEIRAFNALFDGSAFKGDVYDLIYVPGEGTHVFMKGKERATIEGLAFKQALFGIWLGADPVDSGLKEGMLGSD